LLKTAVLAIAALAMIGILFIFRHKIPYL